MGGTPTVTSQLSSNKAAPARRDRVPRTLCSHAGVTKAQGPSESLPQPGAVLSQGVQDGVGDVTAARGTQGLQLVAPSAYRDEPVVCDLLRETQGQHHRL